MGNKKTLQPQPWKPGESGNPNGRPKGAKNFKTLFDQALDMKRKIDQGLHLITGEDVAGQEFTAREIIVFKAVADAMSGDDKARALIIERVDGLLPQDLNLNREQTAEGVLAEIDDLKTKISGRAGNSREGAKKAVSKPGKRKKPS